MIKDYMMSESWEDVNEEEQKVLWAKYLSDKEIFGLPVIVHGEIIFSNEVREEAPCPLCEWEPVDKTFGLQPIKGKCKIVDPYYPEGFVDKGGVWARCPCVARRVE